MGKKGKQASKAARRRSKPKRLWISILALLVVAAGLYSYVGSSGQSSADSQPASTDETESASTDSSLRNRLVLPAWPQRPRPVTLNPQMFTEGVVRQSYQAAKDNPEVLERMACYCGCYSSSGHRSNLQCYADNHGAT